MAILAFFKLSWQFVLSIYKQITETEQTSSIKTHYMAINRLGNTQLKWDSLSFEITWADHVTFFFSLRFLLICWTFSTFFRYVFWFSYLYFTMPESVSSLHECFPFSSLIHSLLKYLLIPYICRCNLLFIYLFIYLFNFIFAFSLLTVLLPTL